MNKITKPLKTYKRECKRCGEWFNSETKLRKICDKCDRSSGSRKWD